MQLIDHDFKHSSLGEVLRFWRKLNRMSQMDLALEVEVSTRHLSFVETGKAQASRELVLKLAAALKLPYRQQNVLLMSAGYAPQFTEEPLSGEAMQMVRSMLDQLLSQHEPYPAIVVNTAYDILLKNTGYVHFVEHYIGRAAVNKFDNAIELLFADDGLKSRVQDWPVAEQFLLAKLAEEAISTQNDQLIRLYRWASNHRTSATEPMAVVHDGLPMVSLKLVKHGQEAAFFSTIATLGSPLDLTTQEMRVELLFPANQSTQNMFPLQQT